MENVDKNDEDKTREQYIQALLTPTTVESDSTSEDDVFKVTHTFLYVSLLDVFFERHGSPIRDPTIPDCNNFNFASYNSH